MGIDYWRQVYVGLLSIVLSPLGTLAVETGPVRVLHFPKDWSMGMLAVRNAGDKDKPYGRFEELCGARGDVTIPGHKDVQLNLSKEAGRDLLPFTRLKGDDLYSIKGWRTPIDDGQWQYLAHLTGLKELLIQYVPISDQNLCYPGMCKNRLFSNFYE